MLRQILIAIGVLMLLGAAIAALSATYAIVPHLLIGGLICAGGIVWERWRYGALRSGKPAPHWQATGERFIDPETQALVEVWYDPQRGERHYLRVPTPR